MPKKIIIIALAIIFVAAIAVIRFWSPEDTWLCQDGQWVKHGQPSNPAPATGCGKQVVDWRDDSAVKQAIQKMLIAKYPRYAKTLTVNVRQQTDKYAAGSITFVPGAAGGQYLAVKNDDNWQFVYEGNGSIDCQNIKQNYQFPTEMLVGFCDNQIEIKDFASCAAAGFPIMESYPRRCQTFTEDIGNELEKTDLIKISNPRPNQTIASPLTITGEARGAWFFEASFPVFLEDKYGNRFAQTAAKAQADWMTENFVPFTAELWFQPNKAYDLADAESFKKTVAEFDLNKQIEVFIILKKDNPSGLLANDDFIKIPVIIKKSP